MKSSLKGTYNGPARPGEKKLPQKKQNAFMCNIFKITHMFKRVNSSKGNFAYDSCVFSHICARTQIWFLFFCYVFPHCFLKFYDAFSIDFLMELAARSAEIVLTMFFEKKK